MISKENHKIRFKTLINKNKLSEINILHLFLWGNILGAIVFLSIYGFSVINVTNDTWIMARSDDLTQHYLGWLYYRNSDWNSIIGLIDGLVYPNKVSLIYMDSIPIFAIIFKLFSPLLPDTFQYIGVYGLISFMLQYGLAALILRKATKSNIICLIGAAFSVFMPIIYQRMFVHTALASHWLILLGFYIWLNKDKIIGTKRNILVWGGLCSLAVSIHMYFIPMLVIIMTFYLLEDCILKKLWKQSIVIWCSSITFALLTMFILGAFVGKASVVQGGVGYYSANINTLFNPMDSSYFLKTLPSATDGQYEGFSYLGFGIIVAIICSIGIFFANNCSLKKYLNKKRYYFYMLAIITTLIISYSPIITLNSKTLIILPYPKVILGVLAIFRCTGRFHWMIMYFVVFVTLIFIIKLLETKKAIFILLLCLTIQVIDISGYISQKTNVFENNNYISQLQAPVWNEISNDYDKVVFITNEENRDDLLLNAYYDYKSIFDLTKFVVDNDMAINDSYVARRDVDAINNFRLLEWNKIINNNPDENTLYIFPKIPFIVLQNNYLHLYKVDGYIIGTKNELIYDQMADNFEKFTMNKGFDINFRKDEFLTNGEDLDEGRVLYKNGVSYGPYISLDKGNYTVTVKGSNLDKIIFNVTSDYGVKTINVTTNSHNSDILSFGFEISEMESNIEFRFYNVTEDKVIINDINLIN